MYPPHSRVGAWLSTHECLAALAGQGHQVDVVTHYPSGPYEIDGVNVLGQIDPFDEFLCAADVVVSHLGDDQRAHEIALEHRIPSVRMVHGTVADAATKLEGDTFAVFNSAAMRSEVGWDGPSTIINPIIDPEKYATAPGDRVTLVNLSANKGGQSLWLLAAMMRDTPFLGVRGGYERQIVRSTTNTDVIAMTENMRDDVYARTRILLMPSARESYGRVAVEAACSGIPTIAHPSPGIREALGPAATFIDRSDLNGWKHEIERLSDPEEWQRASDAALRLADRLEPDNDRRRFVAAIERVGARCAS